MNEPTPITNRLRRAQGGSRFALHLHHAIGLVQLFRRHDGPALVGWAAVRGSLTSLGGTAAEALAGLRVQLAGQQAREGRILDWQAARELGFSDACLRWFCKANQLSPAGTLTVAELRRLLLSRPDLNYRPYAPILKAAGIPLPPLPKPPPT